MATRVTSAVTEAFEQVEGAPRREGDQGNVHVWNRVLHEIPHYASKRISEAVHGDADVVNLSIGEPWFGPPKELPEILARVASRPEELARLTSRYPESLGLSSLRHSIANRYRRLYDLAVDPERQILVTHGSVEAIWLSILVSTEAGDEVVISDPSYMLYEPLVRILGRVPVRVRTEPEAGFCVRAAAIEAHLSERTKLLILNSPENPTGAVCSAAQLRDVLVLAKQRGFRVVHDEVYDSFVFEGKHFPAALLDPEFAVLTNGLSKKFGMPGWRIGWMVAAPATVELAAKAHNYFALSCAGVTQAVADELLANPRTDEEATINARRVYDRCCWFAEALLSIPGLRLPGGRPKGGLFLFVNVSDLYDRLHGQWRGRAASRGEVVAQFLLEDCKIAVVPGWVYGPAGADYIRIVVAVEEDVLKEALRRFRALGERLGD